MNARMLRYLKGTKTQTINYYGDSNDMQGYSNASFGDCKETKLTSRLGFYSHCIMVR